MQTVTLETAKRLKEAGFPQPKSPERGQFWTFLFLPEMPLCVGDCLGEMTLAEFSGADTFLPSATDILSHLPEYAIAVHIDYYGECGEAWFCWDTLAPENTFKHPTNPAEVAAMAWFHENEKTK